MSFSIRNPPADLSGNGFYTKYIDVLGIPILGSDNVSNKALYAAAEIIGNMVIGNKKALGYLLEFGAKVGIIATNELVTDLPDYSDLGSSYDQYRGLGGVPGRPMSSVGEENLLNLPSDPYRGEESILLHEFSHGFENLFVSQTSLESKLAAAYANALSEGLWTNTYAITNTDEYFAEISQSWFDANPDISSPNGIHNTINTRAELKTYDPVGYALTKSVYRDDAWGPGDFLGTSGDDVINGRSDSDFIIAGGGDDVVDGRGGRDFISGGSGKDKLEGGSGSDTLDGGSGADKLYGGSGDDVLGGGPGKDKMYGDSGKDKLSGGSDDDTMDGGSGKDRLYGGPGDDKLKGGSGGGDDKLYGQDDKDRLYGGSGDDFLDGGSGSDKLYGDDDNDKLYGQGGKDKLDGGADNDKVYGGSGDDKAHGGSGKDKIYGENGDDRLFGDSGSDYLVGGRGNDLMYGGSGRDTFHFNKGDDKDKIKDFEDNRDTIELDNFNFSNIADALAKATQEGDDVVFYFGGGDKLTVEDATIAQLSNDLDLV